VAESPVWGPMEIADYLGTTPAYVSLMRNRSQKGRAKSTAAGTAPNPALLPPEDWMVSNRPLWNAQTIRTWAARTGRVLPSES
jgi:hypothetical protein